MTVFNSAGWDRQGIVKIPGAQRFAGGGFVDPEGRVLLSQMVDDEMWVLCGPIPALGSASITFVLNEPTEPAPCAFTVSADGVTTPYYCIRWNDHGQLSQLYDLRLNREILRPGTAGNVMQVFEDKPMAHDAWDIDIYYQEKMREVIDLVEIKPVSVGPVSATMQFVWRYLETVGHQWVDVSENGYGVGLANDCKYGYDVKDGVLRLSLIKSAVHPDPEADQGHHEFTYSLIPHHGGWLAGRVAQEAWDLNSPMFADEGRAIYDGKSLFRLSTDTAMVDAVKLAEDENKIVLRIHDYSGGRQTVHVFSDFEIHSWQACNLLESPEGEPMSEPLQFVLNAYEIKTFLVDMKIFKD